MNGILFQPWKAKLIAGMNVGETVVTRRANQLKEINKEPSSWNFCGNAIRIIPPVREGDALFQHADGRCVAVCPRYHVGEVVFVRETWARVCQDWPPADDNCPFVKEYKADTGNKYPGYWPEGYKDDDACGRWRSPLYLKAIHARSFLKVLSVDAGRVRDITLEDCLLEGIHAYTQETGIYWTWDGTQFFMSAQAAYFALYDSINGEGAHLNHWAFRYLFEKVERT